MLLSKYSLLSCQSYYNTQLAISHSRFSNSGHYVASVDVDGVVK